ncbi:rhodanese-like domain-containing protein [Ditylenchus destructor]|uniref:protein-tyrosine-phosphatase n=1 Tax=Ditylenchus destructor TaxID=166010 RepID=A0AAD4R5M9_9BILA|nr:rhodanese-like domain-containing protein [Ditylenchus destructor]
MSDDVTNAKISTQSTASLCEKNDKLVVEKILDKRQNGDKIEYLVKCENLVDQKWISDTELQTYGDLILKFEMAHENNASRRKTDEPRALVNLTSFPVKCSVSNESFNASAIKKAKSDERKMNIVFINKKVATNIGTNIGQMNQPYSLIAAEKAQIRNDKAFRSISCDTLCELLTSLGEIPFQQKYILVDCRYPYEFNGGHIKLAINLYDVSELPEVFYPQQPAKFQKIKSKTPIFYCEFSQKRGPTMARRLRRLDRDRNHENYPGLDYTEIYVLDRGYRTFHQEGFLDFCEPKSYIPMIHPNHVNDLKKYKRLMSSKRLL